MKYANITLGRVEAVWNKLGGEEGVDRLLSGVSEVVLRKHVIDTAAAPFLPNPNGWNVEDHRKGGALEWDAAKMALHLDLGQEGGKWVKGHELRKRLSGKPVLNANVLDYLIANPHLIPEEWKKKFVFFWGTIYRDSNGDLYVRYLRWDATGWSWHDRWLGNRWYGNDPAAVSAS